MDITALYNLSYGMYIVSAKDGIRNTGCVANSVIQISSSPATFAVSLNKNNYTTGCIQKTGKFAVSVLSENIEESIIGTFGFSSGKDKDKFRNISHKITDSGIAVLDKGTCAYIEGKVINQTDCFTHIIFIAEITDAQKISAETPMTYSFYHKVIKGKTPKNAPAFVNADADTGEKASDKSGKKVYTCSICGYEYPGTPEEFEALSDSYVCPICSAAKSCFVLT